MNRFFIILLMFLGTLSVNAQIRKNSNHSVSIPGRSFLMIELYDAEGIDQRNYRSACRLTDGVVTISSKKVTETLMTDLNGNSVMTMTDSKSRKLTIQVEKEGYKILKTEWSLSDKSENLEVFLTKEE